MTETPSFGGLISVAWDINNRGEAVGEAYTRDDGSRAFIYRNGRLHDLGTLGGSSYAFAINDAGQVVGGYAPDGGVAYRAFFYSDGVMRDIPTPGVGPSLAMAINRDGWVVGTYQDSGKDHPYVFDGAAATELNDSLSPEDQAVWKLISAVEINDKGHITCTAIKRVDGKTRVLVLKPR